VVSPFGPEYNLKEDPAMVAVAIGDPVEEIGPAPPRAANQIMISNSLVPPAVDAVNKSQETSAMMSLPV
jgi:hypothetical protein